MACSACEKQRRLIVDRLRRGDVVGTFKAVSLGVKMISEKAAGVDLAKKYLDDEKNEGR